MKTPWTQEELNYIRQAYSDGKREKVIALELGRSEASVSKTITRHGLRHKRNYALLRERSKKQSSQQKSIKVNRILEDKTFNGHPCNWTTRDNVLKYLCEKSAYFAINYSKGQPEYFFNNQNVSLAKILMEANKIRITVGEPIFHLEDVTE